MYSNLYKQNLPNIHTASINQEYEICKKIFQILNTNNQEDNNNLKLLTENAAKPNYICNDLNYNFSHSEAILDDFNQIFNANINLTKTNTNFLLTQLKLDVVKINTIINEKFSQIIAGNIEIDKNNLKSLALGVNILINKAGDINKISQENKLSIVKNFNQRFNIELPEKSSYFLIEKLINYYNLNQFIF